MLRGFTLLGIGIIHMVEQYFAGPHPKAHENFTVKFLGDGIANGVVSFLISGKFFMIFSFLFGLSFFLQLKNSDGSFKFSLRFLWRLIILFAIGMLHHLHYRGDILTVYALTGVLLVLMYRMPDKVILITGLLLVLNIPVLITRIVDVIQFNPSVAPKNPFEAFMGDDATNLKYFDTLKDGSYFEILKANFFHHGFKMKFQVLSGRLYITAGLFLLGLYAGKKDLFSRVGESISIFKKGLKYSLFTMLGCVVLMLGVFGTLNAMGINPPMPVQFLIGGTVFDVFNTAQATLYVCGLALLFDKTKWHSRLMVFYNVGRMGLTTYLMQTAFGIIIFFGVGFGLLGDIGALTCVGLSIIFFIAQVYFSKWWLSKFQYGLFEWIWRSATLLKVQPLRIQPNP